ncbi:MAG: SIMPL domain-containing protein [Alistipes sp.]
MKKMFLLAVIALMTVPVMAQVQEAFPSYIQVDGRAKKEVTPDEFYLSIVINERESKGKITVEQQQKEMISSLKGLGINIEKQLKMANMSSEFWKKKTSVSTAKYQLQLGSVALVSKVYTVLDAIGISNVSIQKVTHSKIDEYKAQVRIEAIQNAKQCAQALAAAIGQTLGKCFYIYDANNEMRPYYNNMALMRSARANDSMSEESSEDPLEFKTIKLEYSVQTKFVLE